MQTDYSLLFIPAINEAREPRLGGGAMDPRMNGTWAAAGADTGPGGRPGAYDWRVWSNSGFGRRLQSYFSNGDGYSYEVTDFGQVVVVSAAYHNVATGKRIAKTFAIYFVDPNKGNGIVYNTSSKWRTVASVDQVKSYITSTMNSLAGVAKS